MRAERSSCLDLDAIAGLIEGTLDPQAIRAAEAHIARCDRCGMLVADAAQGVLATRDPTSGVKARDDMREASANAPAARAQLPRRGDVIAEKYRIDGILGRGGMGTVLSAEHVELGHRVAIKLLHELHSDGVARFMREAQACASLSSEHVVRIYDIGRLEDGTPFLVLENLVGCDLAQQVARGLVPISDAIAYVRQACAGLAEAHRKGIVHRDLKPSNLFLAQRPDGTSVLKVLDFGVSKLIHAERESPTLSLTDTAMVVGSPRYMSPEQIRASKDVDLRTDVWSLGVILYELITGHDPFPQKSVVALALAITSEQPPPPRQRLPAIPCDLERIILRCLEKDRNQRFPSVLELGIALERLRMESTDSRRDSRSPSSRGDQGQGATGLIARRRARVMTALLCTVPLATVPLFFARRPQVVSTTSTFAPAAAIDVSHAHRSSALAAAEAIDVPHAHRSSAPAAAEPIDGSQPHRSSALAVAEAIDGSLHQAIARPSAGSTRCIPPLACADPSAGAPIAIPGASATTIAPAASAPHAPKRARARQSQPPISDLPTLKRPPPPVLGPTDTPD